MYLSWPLFLLKWTGLDYQPLVLISPYIAHFPLLILSDFCLWEIGKTSVGKPATRVAFALFLTNYFMVEYDIRCFTNTLEKFVTIFVFYFYRKQGNEFNFNTVMMTALLTLGFMMRNTSPVGWIPLLAIKVFRDGAFVPFLIAGIFVFLPLTVACVYIDSVFYQQNSATQTF